MSVHVNCVRLDSIGGQSSGHGATARVLVAEAQGSAPREAGAIMTVWADGFDGTIGGGTLEYEALAHARALLARNDLAPWHRELRTYPLGPALGQCCGGMVRLVFELTGRADAQSALSAPLHPNPPPQGGQGPIEDVAPFATQSHHRPQRRLPLGGRGTEWGWGGKASQPMLIVRPLTPGIPPKAAHSRTHTADWPLPVLRAVRAMLSGTRPRATVLIPGRQGEPAWLIEPEPSAPHTLYLYGAGHVGRAVVRTLQDLPFHILWIDVAEDRFPAEIPPNAASIIQTDPACLAAFAPSEALHLIMSFSHPLDLAITRAVLARDFAWAGLIGSRTKRARFEKRLRESGIGKDVLRKLHCPIGIGGITGKEPAMIAISVAAQLAAWASTDQPICTKSDVHHG